MVWQPKKLCDNCIKLNTCKEGRAGKEACKNYKHYSLPVVPKHGSNVRKGNNMEEIIGTPNKKVKVIIEDDSKITTYFCGGETCINQPRIDTPYKEINKTFNLHNKIGKNFSFTSTEVTITEQDKREEINDSTATPSTIPNPPIVDNNMAYPEWIRTTQILPPLGREVIVTIEADTSNSRGRYTTIGWMASPTIWIVDNEICNTVTHWMPFPEPSEDTGD